ncbi:NAD(P)H-dependent oxidoreductase subunit E [Streptomyces sp. NPDC002825]|uniref:NAD(P)H-dependent oxidoreductase subunit E n=1 Tax=Streptomyces sp. NPDC002825 TaxID=3154666 RepID=UPI00333345D7
MVKLATRRAAASTATACFAARGGRHLAEVERALGVTAGTVDAAGSTSLQTVHCLGYCYTGPAALDGTLPRTAPDLADQLAGRAEPRAGHPRGRHDRHARPARRHRGRAGRLGGVARSGDRTAAR